MNFIGTHNIAGENGKIHINSLRCIVCWCKIVLLCYITIFNVDLKHIQRYTLIVITFWKFAYKTGNNFAYFAIIGYMRLYEEPTKAWRLLLIIT